MEIEEYIVADDRQLVALATEGDAQAFEYLFQRYRDSIRRLFALRTGNGDDADDLLQETFVKVYINIHRYSADYTFGQWIYTIARNTFIDFARKRQDALPLDERYAVPVESSAPTPEERVISIQQRSQLDGYMANMSADYRQLIELRFFDELSYEEISQRLSIPLGTVKTRIHRARERLCRLITEGDNE